MTTFVRTGLVLVIAIAMLYVEVSPGFSAQTSSQQLDPKDAREELLLKFIDSATGDIKFLSPERAKMLDTASRLPESFAKFDQDAINQMEVSFNNSTFGNSALGDLDEIGPIGQIRGDQTANLNPPESSLLARALENGGKIFYESASRVVIAFPEDNSDRFKSFFKATGMETDWLQTELNLPIIDTDGAFETYIERFEGEPIAETSSWVLLRFPEGSYLKVAKPEGYSFRGTDENQQTEQTENNST